MIERLNNLLNTPPTPPGRPTTPETRSLDRGQTREAILDFVRQNKPTHEQLVAHINSLNSRWTAVEMRLLTLSRTLRANVVSKPEGIAITYFLEG